MTTTRIRPSTVLSFLALQIFLLLGVVRFGHAQSNPSSLHPQLQTEFQLKLPKGFQQRVIDQQWGVLQKQVFASVLPLPDQSIHAQDVEVLLTGIQLDLQTKLQKPALPRPGPSLVLQSRDMTAHLRVQTLSVDQFIVREIGGVVGRFHLQARCDNLDLQLKPGEGKFQIQLSPVLQGPKISSRVDDLSLAWSQKAWSLAPMTCTGAKGFEDVVAEHIAALTSNSDLFTNHKAELIAYVQKSLDAQSVDLSKPRVISQSGRPDLQYSLQIHQLAGDGQNLSAFGVLSVYFRNLKKTSPVFLKLGKTSSSGAASSAAQLRLPEKFLQVALQMAFVPNTWKSRVMSENVPGFTAFRASPLAECFLWPALHRFPQDARFAFDLSSRAPLEITGKALNYFISTVMDVDMLAPQEGRAGVYIPFMSFQVPLESQIQLSLQQGALHANFSNVKGSLEPTWAESYVQNYRPNQNFAATELERKLVKSAEGSTVSYPLPVIQFLQGSSFRVQSVQAAGSDLILSMY